MPKDAGYGHVCTIDPNGPLMNRIKEVFETKTQKTQLKGLTESEVLWCSFQGNADAMQTAIDKGDLKEHNCFFYWHSDIHEHTRGGTDRIKFGAQSMTIEDKDKVLESLDFASWAAWGTTSSNHMS